VETTASIKFICSFANNDFQSRLGGEFAIEPEDERILDILVGFAVLQCQAKLLSREQSVHR
jgi:hypothetical protein